MPLVSSRLEVKEGPEISQVPLGAHTAGPRPGVPGHSGSLQGIRSLLVLCSVVLDKCALKCVFTAAV